MNSCTLELTTKSYTCFSDIENNVFIDSDITFDDVGLPYIKARRMKGLLKESVLEILELIEDKEKSTIINRLFGEKGKTEGVFYWDSFYLHNYEEIRNQILNYNHNDSNAEKISPSFIKQYYTELIPSTAIEHTGKSAKQNSLRTVRALKMGLTFSAALNYKTIEVSDKEIFKLAVLNIQEVGLNRNRGMGDVSITVNDDQTDKEIDSDIVSNSDITEDKTKTELKLRYRLKQPVIIPINHVDSNTVSSSDSIPGNVLRGALVNLLPNNQINSFYNKNKIQFGYGFPVTSIDENGKKYAVASYPLPFFIHEIKDKKDDYINIFTYKGDEITKPKRGIGRAVNSGSNSMFYSLAVKKIYGFHSSRSAAKERLTGKNESETGAIFYYEAIAPEQEFEFTLFGEKHLLQKLKAIVDSNKIIRLGKSKTVEYGKAELVIAEFVPDENGTGKDFVLSAGDSMIISLLSPAILLNQFGNAQPDCDTLQHYLTAISRGCNIEKAALGICSVEIGNSLWKTMPLGYKAIQQGASFLIKNNSKDPITFPAFIGEFTDMGFGQIMMLKNEEYKYAEDKIYHETGSQKNDLIIFFEQDMKLKEAELKGFIDGKKKQLKSTSASSLYELVKKSTEKEIFYANFNENRLSPALTRKLIDNGIYSHVTALNEKEWKSYTKPYLLGYFRAIRINAKNQNNER